MKKKRINKKSLGCACQDKPLNGPAASVAKEVGIAILPKVIGWGVGIGAVYFLLIKPVLESVGVLQTKDDKAKAEQTAANSTSLNNPFNPRYYQDRGTGSQLLTKASAEAMAEQLYKAVGTFYDDENAVYGVLRQLKYKTQVSFLADVFYKKYGIDLYNLLERNFGSNELSVVNNIVSNLL